jgi:hypothetical protein
MFYRIKENKLYDYADYNYGVGCLETNIITQKELIEHPNKVVVQNGELVLNPNYEKEEKEKQKQKRKQEILKLLDELDLKSIRAIRASDEEYIEKYEQEAIVLREELRELGE